MRKDRKQLEDMFNRLADDVAALEKLAAEKPALVDDQAILRLHQLGAKLQHVLVNGMLCGKPEFTPAQPPAKHPRLYGGTRPN
jgi:hypothetical protein